ncbi:T9SS type A sorting domain-containing protein [Reichenbachiella sp.]|uniref:T9SS type A sorting domain-containing protein n=1 Tax=Reichenbachiella sp. TaxID=2184521 RepID=UPI003BB1224B
MQVNRKILFLLFLIGISTLGFQVKAQVAVDINFDVKHQVGSVSTFDRNKFVTIHADINENEWEGNNFTEDLRNDLLNGYDVYMGRNTGGITWYLNSSTNEDPSRSGYANPSDITSNGTNLKNTYAAQTSLHVYEHRNDQIIAAQLHPFYPDGQLINDTWSFSQNDTDEEPFGTATGEYMGRFIRDAFGSGTTAGQPKPKYVEVINEPLWHLVDYGDDSPEQIFKFHNSVADEIRKYNDDVVIGGYCTAFPDHETDDFKEWEERWKLFMDMSGEKMDYWTIHLYDFPSINNGKQLYRKGSNMEATFDIMEQYSFMKFGEVKPFMISEFGAQMHDYFGAWSAYRDWLHIKASNSMMMQFMERADIINKTVNFLPLKAEWGTSGVDDTYNHRLLRKADEPESYTGEWVYTDMIKIYQLWSEVKGTRIDTYSTDLDVMVDAYVDGHTAFLIFNNLKFSSVSIALNDLGLSDNKVKEVETKHLFLKDNAALLNTTTSTEWPETITLGAEATIILKCTFENEIEISDTSIETKYYADSYLKPIQAGTTEVFNINGVASSSHGEAVLRIGIGREHGKSLSPEIKFNGEILTLPGNIRGDEQTDRDSFFGVMEIAVSHAQLKESNEVSITFEDGGGHISSVALQVFEFSRAIERLAQPFALATSQPVTQNATIIIFPNPSQDSLSIQFASELIGNEWKLVAVDGSTILGQTISTTRVNLDVSGLPAGLYWLSAKQGNKIITKKIVKQ